MTTLRLDYASLWDGICKWGRKAGRAAMRPVLVLWYVMRSPDTPKKDKLAIFASLAYLVLPIDLLDAKRLPIIGWLDEAVSIAVMIQKMSKHITPDIEANVNIQLDKWFPEYTEYELIKG